MWETTAVYLASIVGMFAFGIVALCLLFRRRKEETALLHEAWMSAIRVQNEVWQAMIAERKIHGSEHKELFQTIQNYNQWMTHFALLVSNDANAKAKAFTDMSEKVMGKLVGGVDKKVR